MQWLHDLSYFFGGAFLANAIPHGVSGITGHAFQTPFAKPPGKGLSSAPLNVAWSFINLVIAYLLIAQVGAFDWRIGQFIIALGLGAFLAALMLARFFAPLHGGTRDSRS